MKSLLSSLFLFLFLQTIYAQFPDSTLVQHTIASKAFGEDRQITVHLPSRYIANPDEPMVVTYVLDAQGPQYFNMLLGNFDYLTSRYGIVPTIVVGIHSKNRYAEFTPFAREGTANQRDAEFESKLPNFYEHLEKEVFPWVEANFKTKPFRTIVGHSRGGSFVVQCLFDGHHDLFDAYLAISPALQFDNYQSIDWAEKKLKAKLPKNKFLYVSAGDVGENERFFAECVQKLDAVVKNNPNPSLVYHEQKFPGKDHFTTVGPSLNHGLVLLKNEIMPSFENMEIFLKNNSIPVSQQIDQFISERKKNNQFIHEPSMRYYAYLANDLFEEEDYKNALDLFLWIDQKEPMEEWWEVFNIGKCYHQLNNKEQAQKYFDQSLLKLDERKEEYGEKFDKIKANVIQQLADLN